MCKNEEVENLYVAINRVRPKAVLFTGFPNLQKKMNTCPKSLPEIAFEYKTNSSDSVTPCDFVNSLCFNSDDVSSIEIYTRGQNNNPAWQAQRQGCITASISHEISNKMSEIVKQKCVKTSPLVATVLGKSNNLEFVESIKYGRTNEPTARNLFCILQSVQHRNFKVDVCGLFVKPERPYIAASPDAIVTCSCCQKSVLEIKCPYSLSTVSITEGWGKLDYLCMDEGVLSLKKTHKYYTQVQTQMAVTGCNIAYFFVWSPKGSLSLKIDFDVTFWIKLQEKICNFFKSFVAPVLIRIKDLYYCPVCDKVCCEPEEIVKNEDNSINCECYDLWFHWKCANISATPTQDAWICQNCLLNAVDM